MRHQSASARFILVLVLVLILEISCGRTGCPRSDEHEYEGYANPSVTPRRDGGLRGSCRRGRGRGIQGARCKPGTRCSGPSRCTLCSKPVRGSPRPPRRVLTHCYPVPDGGGIGHRCACWSHAPRRARTTAHGATATTRYTWFLALRPHWGRGVVLRSDRACPQHRRDDASGGRASPRADSGGKSHPSCA